jgi:radical SAM protein with 4Fe4S-binding SPASM domain
VDSDEKGVLMVDASKLIFLNGTALDYVRCILENLSENETVKYMRRRYKKLGKEKARGHLKKMHDQLKEFLEGNMNVLQTVGAESPSIGADSLPSPYRMDLALTYKCQNACGHCYNENRDKEPLELEEWVAILQKLWDNGVPHIVFTGGEPTLSPHLKKLIMKSEELGQITGIITNGRKLAKKGYLEGLIKAGLDHVQVTVLSHRESVHDKLTGHTGSWRATIDGLKKALQGDLYVNTNTTIMRSNFQDVEETMRYLVGLGVKNIAFNCIIRSGKGKTTEGLTYEELGPLLENLKKTADENQINMIWYSPTPYCELNPVNYGLGIKQCTACSINMAIEPDGTVLPCQSCYEPLGNMLKDDWDDIWNHETCKKIRGRKYLPEECKKCDLKHVCGGGCPLSLEHGDYQCLDRSSNM